jgi:hypothetical protein
MASITQLTRGTDGEYFEPSERSDANVERVGDLQDEMLARFPDTWGLAKDTTQRLAVAVEESRDLATIGPEVASSSDTDDVCGPVGRQAQLPKPRRLRAPQISVLRRSGRAVRGA